MVEDTNDGSYYAPPPSGAAVRTGPGPIAVGTFNYAMSEQSLSIRVAANEAIRQVGTRRGLARFMGLTETQGVYCAHPLGGCRMAESPDLGVVDDSGGLRLRGALLHRRLDRAHLARGQPVAHDLGPERALRRAPGYPRRRPWAPTAILIVEVQGAAAARGRTRDP
jgi:hypothetical protein